MRGGPEVRITGAVTTVNADTSVVITQDDANTMDQKDITTVTIAMALTSGWTVGEVVEIAVRSLGGSGQQGLV